MWGDVGESGDIYVCISDMVFVCDYVGNARIDGCLIIEKKVNGSDYGIVKPIVGELQGRDWTTNRDDGFSRGVENV